MTCINLELEDKNLNIVSEIRRTVYIYKRVNSVASDEKCDQAGYFLKSYTETKSFLSRRTFCELSDFHYVRKCRQLHRT